MFPTIGSSGGQAWQVCQFGLEFRRSLYRTDWIGADNAIREMAAWDPREAQFLR